MTKMFILKIEEVVIVKNFYLFQEEKEYDFEDANKILFLMYF